MEQIMTQWAYRQEQRSSVKSVLRDFPGQPGVLLSPAAIKYGVCPSLDAGQIKTMWTNEDKMK
ncbi:MAG: hypothetical protein J0652_04010 [Desulfobulbaceae bacterium]|jgi:hypothetical protein|nr:hypothetical protein [Desulfobulbaceae bacterium]